MRTRIARVAPALLVWSGAAACVLGFVLHRLWQALPPQPRLVERLVLALLSLAIAGALNRMRGWSWATGLATAWLAALVFFAGVPAVAATLLIAAGALALGSLLVPREMPAIALPVGLVVLGGSLGWLLPLPLPRWYLYAPLLLGLCVARRDVLHAGLRGAAPAWRAAVAAAPRTAAFAVLALGLASTGTWLPTMQADDLAYHLALPTHLQLHGVYRPDPALQIWAFAPWLGDVVQGLAQVLAGREARGAVDALWLLAAALALWRLAATLHAPPYLRWLALALLASLPPLAALAGGMQTELPALALLLALAALIAGPPDPRRLRAGAVLAAGLCALKFGQLVAALVLLAWALLRARGRVPWTRLPAALALFAVLAGSSYVHAWRVSGNPLLPLFNQVFHSPLLAPRQLDDARWHAGFGLDLPWSITFRTSDYLEAWDGAFGFVLVALAGAWLLALLRRDTRAPTLAASAVLLLPLLPMQYARYAFPGLVLLLVPLLLATAAALGARRCTLLVGALCVLGLVYQPNANWLLRTATLRQLVRDGGATGTVLARYAPERALIAELRRRDPGDSLVLALDPASPTVAELAARGRSVAWYAPRLEAARVAADADASGARWQAVFDDLQVRWLLLRPQRLTEAQRAGLARCGAERVAAAGDAELWSHAAAHAAEARATP
jgi:hypothetical protein